MLMIHANSLNPSNPNKPINKKYLNTILATK